MLNKTWLATDYGALLRLFQRASDAVGKMTGPVDLPPLPANPFEIKMIRRVDINVAQALPSQSFEDWVKVIEDKAAHS